MNRRFPCDGVPFEQFSHERLDVLALDVLDLERHALSSTKATNLLADSI
jgi:hypothetical protein